MKFKKKFALFQIFFVVSSSGMDQTEQIYTKLKERWHGKEKKLKELLLYTSNYKSQAEYSQREESIGSLDGRNKLVTTKFTDKTQYECRFEILWEVLNLDHIDSLSKKDNEDGPIDCDKSGKQSLRDKSSKQENLPLMSKKDSEEEHCCCRIS